MKARFNQSLFSTNKSHLRPEFRPNIIYNMNFLKNRGLHQDQPGEILKPASAMFVLSGNCRTFVDCIDSISTNLILKLFTEEVTIHIYLYLKLTDPGPKGQEGWDFEYKDNDHTIIIDKIRDLKSKYPTFHIEYKLLNTDEISNEELLGQVKDRSLYRDFYGEDSKLVRGMHCHYNLEKCGNYIVQKEASIQRKFDYIIYVRPDLFFTSGCGSIENYHPSIITIVHDHIALVPREHLNSFFFDRMSVYRNNTDRVFREAEDVYFHTIKHEVKPMGDYFIKR